MRTLSKENKTIIGYVIIGVCLAVFGILAVSALALKKNSYDPDTFCPGDIKAHTIVILDKTDSLSPNQQRFVLDYINKAKDKLETFEKFSIFILDEDTHTNPAPLFSKCNPGSKESANQLYQNPGKIQKRFDEFFLKPLKENMKNVLADNTGSQSPIFEMIREVSLREDFGPDVKKRTLIIVSDMMHHTSRFSHYKSRSSYGYFSKKSYAFDVVSNVNAVEVRVVYLLRSKLAYSQGSEHLAFWEGYFEDMGAIGLAVRKIR